MEGLRRTPSSGPIRASSLIVLTQTPHCFRTKQRLWAYSGLALEARNHEEWHPDVVILARNVSAFPVGALTPSSRPLSVRLQLTSSRSSHNLKLASGRNQSTVLTVSITSTPSFCFDYGLHESKQQPVRKEVKNCRFVEPEGATSSSRTFRLFQGMTVKYKNMK